jgi:uncharacterized protein (TIGR00369 family)
MAMPFKVHIPFVQQLGMQLQRMDPDEAEISLELREELTNSWGVAHGGVTMTLLDVAMAHAARSPQREGGEIGSGVVTLEMKTSFLRPGLGLLRATGRRLHMTTTLAFCEGHVHDAEGRLVAHGSGSFKFLKGLPVGDGRRVQRLNASD